jgi:hypothetical protein
MGVSARPGRTAAKYSRTGMFVRRQVSTDTEDGGDFGSGLLAADVDPVSATERHRAHGVFGEIVAEFEFRVFQETCEFRPKRHLLA